jgi:hypothetical protein
VNPLAHHAADQVADRGGRGEHRDRAVAHHRAALVGEALRLVLRASGLVLGPFGRRDRLVGQAIDRLVRDSVTRLIVGRILSATRSTASCALSAALSAMSGTFCDIGLYVVLWGMMVSLEGSRRRAANGRKTQRQLQSTCPRRGALTC